MSDLMRIGANIQALRSFESLMNVNDLMSIHQLRLATGKKINSAGEDPAGYALARSLESRKKGLSVADGSLSTTQVSALNSQVTALITEIDEIASGTKFNGYSLIGSSADTLVFQTGEGASDNLTIQLDSADSSATGLGISDVNLNTGAAAAMTTLSSAIDTLSGSIQEVGQFKARLDTKESNLSVAITNTEAVRSKIEDADFAKEQMEVMKLQILQQTALSSFVQSNASPQIVLSLFQ